MQLKPSCKSRSFKHLHTLGNLVIPGASLIVFRYHCSPFCNIIKTVIVKFAMIYVTEFTKVMRRAHASSTKSEGNPRTGPGGGVKLVFPWDCHLECISTFSMNDFENNVIDW